MINEKWVTDLKTELEKLPVKDLESLIPAGPPTPSGGIIFEPSKEDSAAMVTMFREGKTPNAVSRLLIRDGHRFSLEQVNAAYETWRTVLNAKTAPPVEEPKDPIEPPGDGK